MAFMNLNLSVDIYHPLVEHLSFDDTTSVTPLMWPLRCVVLHSGQFSDPIQCDIVYSTLSDVRDHYEALSYTWGDMNDRSEILVNGRPFPVTRNLEAALRDIRLGDTTRMLWVDSICINQEDISEVNIQVQRMWAIYEYAHQVLVFLGEADRRSDSAFGLLSELSQLRGASGADRITMLLNDQHKSASWDALLCLLQRPWWGRAWIIQEYAVAKVVVFICGANKMDGEVFGRALETLVEYRFSDSVPRAYEYLIRHVASTPIHHLWIARQRYQTSGPSTRPDAIGILYRFRGSQSFDPRDKVYSLHRLIAENPKLKPDYAKKVHELYKDVVSAMIESSNTLEVLSHHNRSIEGLSDLPTWCPDWTVRRGKRILLWPNQYRAAGDPSVPALFRVSGNILTLKGKIIDRIQWLKNFESDDFKNIQKIYEDVKYIENATIKYSKHNFENPDRVRDAFRRTLVAARIRERGPNNDPTILGLQEADQLWDAWSRQREGKPYNKTWATWYNEALYSALCGRAFIITQQGFLGLVDGTAQTGDTIGVFVGGQVPFALHTNIDSPKSRAVEDMTGHVQYELIGECYLHGFMSGEAFEPKPSLAEFDIV
ncbi:HET-domain-containing protein [Annulohypoxylon nitens]|nr:HET-domain-containing protein [Annulohypoxylon nitens]